MKTKIRKLDPNNIDKKILNEAVQIVRAGGTVVFPTETVYGLGANGLNEEAVMKIFKAKGRPADNPLILHIYSIGHVEALVKNIPETAEKCMEAFWPGPLTILFKKSSKVPKIITAGLDTVAIRMPKNNIALELIKEANIPIAAPSANVSGRPSPTSAKHVIDDLDGKVDMIIDGGDTGIGIESTVLDLSGDIPVILRPGAVTIEDLKKIIPNVKFDPSTSFDAGTSQEDENIFPKSPGQKYRHYAPKAEMILFTGDIENIIE
ncbi:MAG: threonylcarbamoyl-AMP synthase, partial [Tissierellia bacterium]|nr:threonylcarbamoyl-AMP synthase [Tissierellia bacterium]